MRVHLFEWEDQLWFPEIIRSGGTDFLRYLLIRSELYKPAISLINETLQASKQVDIIDLCSGGGGSIFQLYEGLKKIRGDTFTLTISDKFPNYNAFAFIHKKSCGKINFISSPIDIFNIPAHINGLRVLFSAIHHFTPLQVKGILQDATDHQKPIAIFDGFEKKWLAALALLIIHPMVFILCTPFFKPFRWSRILFTYIIPLIPLYTIWDGLVSIGRLYNPTSLFSIAHSVDNNNYFWKSGYTKNRFGLKSSYLIGYPIHKC